jgi:tetratricopeptide (TPR) repeat protein
MLVTVSPVPFKATFSGEDVIVANAYSKAVQRAACQVFAERCAGVDYFPSYELVTMSPRESAYESDNLHVTAGMVRHVMNEVLAAYAPEIATAPVKAEIAESRLGRPLGGHFDHLARAKHLNANQQHAEAALVCEELLATYGAVLSPSDLSAARSVYSAALRGLGRWAEVATQLELAAAQDPRGGEVFYKLGQTREQLGLFAEAAMAYRQAMKLDSARPEFSAGLTHAEARIRLKARSRIRNLWRLAPWLVPPPRAQTGRSP